MNSTELITVKTVDLMPGDLVHFGGIVDRVIKVGHDDHVAWVECARLLPEAIGIRWYTGIDSTQEIERRKE